MMVYGIRAVGLWDLAAVLKLRLGSKQDNSLNPKLPKPKIATDVSAQEAVRGMH